MGFCILLNIFVVGNYSVLLSFRFSNVLLFKIKLANSYACVDLFVTMMLLSEPVN
jgi:hypothetical protein